MPNPPSTSSNTIPIGTKVRIKSREELLPLINRTIRNVLLPPDMLAYCDKTFKILSTAQGSHTIVYHLGTSGWSWVPEWFDILPTITPKRNVLNDLSL